MGSTAPDIARAASGPSRRGRRRRWLVRIDGRVVALGRELDAAVRSVDRRKAVEAARKMRERIPFARHLPDEDRHPSQCLVAMANPEPVQDLRIDGEQPGALGNELGDPRAGAQDQFPRLERGRVGGDRDRAGARPQDRTASPRRSSAPARRASVSWAVIADSGRTNPASGSKYASVSSGALNIGNPSRSCGFERLRCGIPWSRATARVCSRNPSSRWPITSPPICSSTLHPVAASSSRQSSCERRTNGTCSAPSPTASRVIRVSPWVDPRSCGGREAIHPDHPQTPLRQLVRHRTPHRAESDDDHVGRSDRSR